MIHVVSVWGHPQPSSAAYFLWLYVVCEVEVGLCTHPHTYSLDQRDEGNDRVLPRELFGLPAGGEAAAPFKIACQHERGCGGGGGGGEGAPWSVFVCESVVELGGGGWGLGCGDMRGWVVAGS